MTKLMSRLVGTLLVVACTPSPKPIIPKVAPVVAALPGSGRTSEDAALEAELEAGLGQDDGPARSTPTPAGGAGGSAP